MLYSIWIVLSLASKEHRVMKVCKKREGRRGAELSPSERKLPKAIAWKGKKA